MTLVLKGGLRKQELVYLSIVWSEAYSFNCGSLGAGTEGKEELRRFYALAVGNRLGDIGIGTQRHATLLLERIDRGGIDNDGNVLERFTAFQVLKRLCATHPGHVQVEHHQAGQGACRFIAVQQVECLFAVFGKVNVYIIPGVGQVFAACFPSAAKSSDTGTPLISRWK